MKTAIRFRIPAVLLVAITLTACSDKSLERAAKAIESVAIVNDTLAQTVIAEHAAGVISESDARIILNQVCSKVATATILTANLTAQYTTFPADARPQIAPLLQPILDAIKEALDTGLTGIKNPQTLTNIRNSLLTIQTGLVAAQAALGGK
jgi:hypothetical protein